MCHKVHNNRVNDHSLEQFDTTRLVNYTSHISNEKYFTYSFAFTDKVSAASVPLSRITYEQNVYRCHGLLMKRKYTVVAD
jgi:hypothetical protein